MFSSRILNCLLCLVLYTILMQLTEEASMNNAKIMSSGFKETITVNKSDEGLSEETASATAIGPAVQITEKALMETVLINPIVRTITPPPTSREDEIRRHFQECESEINWLCLKIRFVKLLERLSELEEFTVITGVSFVKVPDSKEQKATEIMAEVARSYPNDPHVRLNALIFAKLEQFLRSHYLRVKLLDPTAPTDAETETNLVVTGRKGHHGKKKKKMEKHMEMAIAAIVVMKATLLVVAGAGVAGLAGAALATSLASLAASAYIMVKSMMKSHGSGHKSTSYEIVAKPVYTSSHTQSVVPDETMHTATGYGATGYASTFGRSLQLEMPVLRHLQKGFYGS